MQEGIQGTLGVDTYITSISRWSFQKETSFFTILFLNFVSCLVVDREENPPNFTKKMWNHDTYRL